MYHEATKTRRVTVPAGTRECKQSSAPGEVPVKVLSDGGSTPPISTTTKLHKTLFLLRRIRCNGVVCVVARKAESIQSLSAFLFLGNAYLLLIMLRSKSSNEISFTHLFFFQTNSLIITDVFFFRASLLLELILDW